MLPGGQEQEGGLQGRRVGGTPREGERGEGGPGVCAAARLCMPEITRFDGQEVIL